MDLKDDLEVRIRARGFRVDERIALLAALGVPYSVWATEIGVLLLLCLGLGMQAAWRDGGPR